MPLEIVPFTNGDDPTQPPVSHVQVLTRCIP
jgi:hypothetical protein